MNNQDTLRYDIQIHDPKSLKAANQAGLVPIGATVPYFGQLTHLNGKLWQLCDGSEIKTGPLKGNKTPLLGDLFIRATTDQVAVGRIQGQNDHKHAGVGNIGGSFSGGGSGRTIRGSGQLYPWGESNVHSQNEGPQTFSAEWNVNVSVTGGITTGSHEHAEAGHIPRHVQVLFIMRIG